MPSKLYRGVRRAGAAALMAVWILGVGAADAVAGGQGQDRVCFDGRVDRPEGDSNLGRPSSCRDCGATQECKRVTLDGFLKNDDGTVTLTFTASNACLLPMGYVAFSLPEGIAAVSPANSSRYEAGRSYNVENPAKKPFHGIKFETRGPGIRLGASDVFAFTVPGEALALMDGMQTAMKIGPTVYDGSQSVDIPGSIGGRVWNDVNENGIADPAELGMEGVAVVLWSCEGGAPAVIATSMVSGEDGFYVFADLPRGDYAVQVITPVGFFFGPQDAPGVDELLDSDVAHATGFTGCIVLLNAEDNLTVNAGVVQALFPDVKVNGSDDAIVLAPADPLSVTVSLAAHAQAATYEGEFWMVAALPSGLLYSYNLTTLEWSLGLTPAGHFQLLNYAPVTILDLQQAGSTLPEGATTFYLGIDLIVNNQLDDYIVDFVSVTITP